MASKHSRTRPWLKPKPRMLAEPLWPIAMDKLIIIILTTITFTSCKKPVEKNNESRNQKESISVIQQNTTDSIPKLTTDTDDDLNKIDSSQLLTPFDITSIPNKWIRLTETDSGMIVFNSCNGGNKLVDISRKEEQTEILYHGQQEDSRYLIHESGTIDSTIIYIKVQYVYLEPEGTIHVLIFRWIDKDKGLVEWEDVYSINKEIEYEIFVSDQFVSNYQVYDQPCIECWSQEDCDEFEKNNGP